MLMHKKTYKENNMGKVILYLAMSLDGYIADSKGHYDFLNHYSDMDSYDYQGFLSKVGTIIMGRKSFDLVKQQKTTWEFDGFRTYVYSRHEHKGSENIHFTNMRPGDLIKKIKSESDKDIWLFGGSEIIDLFVKDHAVEEYWLYYVAEVLSSGIPLFRTPILDEMEVKGVRQFGNIVEIRLAPKKHND